MNINVDLAKKLINKQFPEFNELPIRKVASMGEDNYIYHVGDRMLIRIPRHGQYAAQAMTEQKWLPLLAPHLSVQIPKPVASGTSSIEYHWNFSIYEWITGDSLNTFSVHKVDYESLTKSIGGFLKELHSIDTQNGPVAAIRNFWKGGDLSVYTRETTNAISCLINDEDEPKALKIWEEALQSSWQKEPVWIHGDLNAENIIMENNKLKGIIDWGNMGIGDPACDLVITWTFLPAKYRHFFKSLVGLDTATWQRAKGWALWKALTTLKSSREKYKQQEHMFYEMVREMASDETSDWDVLWKASTTMKSFHDKCKQQEHIVRQIINDETSY